MFSSTNVSEKPLKEMEQLIINYLNELKLGTLSREEKKDKKES